MSQDHVVRNRDRCGRCGAIHGGNSHSCPIHGHVSEGCCEPRCNPTEWVSVGERDPKYPSLSPGFRAIRRDDIDLSEYTLDPPYNFQNDGAGNYKPGSVERYILEPS